MSSPAGEDINIGPSTDKLGVESAAGVGVIIESESEQIAITTTVEGVV